jgi:hypothetical protein
MERSTPIGAFSWKEQVRLLWSQAKQIEQTISMLKQMFVLFEEQLIIAKSNL